MKKIAITAVLLLAALPWHAAAQVEKQVEVTKAYVPRVEPASKLAVAPDMTDTVKMRPEIDYSITPLSLQRAFETRPIRPATVTYWEFNRPQPFYLKVGAGYPLNSTVDFYASTQHPGTGYLLGYVNHEGRYADIRNDFGVKNNSVRMTNRVGVAAGKYFGRHTLEADVWYDNRLYHRYGAYASSDPELDQAGAAVDYGEARAAVRFGDDFQDLARVNFEVALSGGLFSDHSKLVGTADRTGLSDWAVRARVAKGFGRHRIGADLSYERLAGSKAVEEYKEQLLRVGVRYGYDGGVVRFEAGADYCHDRIPNGRSGDYVTPFLRMDFDLGTRALRPFVELDGDVRANNCRTLTRENPYVCAAAMPGSSSVDYNGRIGIGGGVRSGAFGYRAYVAFSIRDNRLYWLGLPAAAGVEGEPAAFFGGSFLPVQARQTVMSFNGEVEFRPVSPLRLSLGLHGYLYNDEGCPALEGAPELENGAPSFEGDFDLRYEGRRITFGVGVALRGKCGWSLLDTVRSDESGLPLLQTMDTPFAADLRALFEWKVSGGATLFARGSNLAGCKIYDYGWYRAYGANFTVGVKLNF